MSKTPLFVGGALLASAALAFCGAASAGVSFIPLGPLAPAGFTVITDFNTVGLGTLSGTGTVSKTQSGITSGSVYDVSAAPELAGSVRDTNPYLAVEYGSPVTVTPAGAYKDIALYVGSLDPYNSLKFTFDLGTMTESFTGSELAAATTAQDSRSQTSSLSNGLFIFTFPEAVTKFTISSTQPAFEIAEISGGVPEPASWALMLIGVAGIGGAMRFRRRQAAVAA